jgi:hypothetical protein
MKSAHNKKHEGLAPDEFKLPDVSEKGEMAV